MCAIHMPVSKDIKEFTCWVISSQTNCDSWLSDEALVEFEYLSSFEGDWSDTIPVLWNASESLKIYVSCEYYYRRHVQALKIKIIDTANKPYSLGVISDTPFFIFGEFFAGDAQNRGMDACCSSSEVVACVTYILSTDWAFSKSVKSSNFTPAYSLQVS